MTGRGAQQREGLLLPANDPGGLPKKSFGGPAPVNRII
jgi:hypothetical protein